jgi:hypothetical protein
LVSGANWDETISWVKYPFDRGRYRENDKARLSLVISEAIAFRFHSQLNERPLLRSVMSPSEIRRAKNEIDSDDWFESVWIERCNPLKVCLGRAEERNFRNDSECSHTICFVEQSVWATKKYLVIFQDILPKKAPTIGERFHSIRATCSFLFLSIDSSILFSALWFRTADEPIEKGIDSGGWFECISLLPSNNSIVFDLWVRFRISNIYSIFFWHHFFQIVDHFYQSHLN